MMIDPARNSRCHPRRHLFASTALAAALVHAPLGAAGLPVGGLVGGVGATPSNVTTTVATGGAAGALGGATGMTLSADPTKSAVTFSVNSDKSVVEWSEFNIASGKTVNFTNGTGNPGFTVLNRVTGSTGSTISGTLNGGGGSIWLINENGIGLVGGTVTNVAGFVASTLNVSDGDFTAQPADGYRFVCSMAAACLAPNGINIDGTSTITTSGPVILVGPKLDTSGTISAGGDVGMVVAADAKVLLTGDSIIGVSIAAGTTVTPTNALSVSGGSVSGANVYAVAVTPADVVGTLLKIDGTIAATASPGGTGVVLSSGAAATNVTVTAGLGGGGAVVSGGVTSTGDYSVTGTTVTLGSASATAALPVSQSAAGNVTIRSTVGAIAALGTQANALGLLSNSDGSGGGNLFLDSAAAITGAPKLTAGTSAQRSDVGIRLGDATKAVTLGGVIANRLGTADYVVADTPLSGYTLQSTFTTGGAITTGTVVTSQALTIHSTGGNVIVGGANSLDSVAGLVDVESDTGAVTLGSASSGALNVKVAAATAATVTGAVDSAGDYTVTGATVALGSATATAPVAQSARGAVVIRSTVGDITAPGVAPNIVTLTANSDGSGSETLILDSFGAIDAAGLNLVGGTALQPSAIGLRLELPISAITLGDVTGGLLGSVDYVMAMTPSSGYAAIQNALATAGPITLGNVSTDSPLTVTTTGVLAGISIASADSTGAAGAVDIESQLGAVTLGSATSSFGDVKVVAGTAASVTGTVSSAQDYLVTGATVALGDAAATAATAVTQAAKRNIAIRSLVGTIAALGTEDDALVLNAASNGVPGTMTLRSAAAITGGARLIDGKLTAGVVTLPGDIVVTLDTAGSAVTFGTVDAKSLTTAGGVFSTSGAITMGAVTTVAPLTIKTNGALSDVAVGAAHSTGAAGAVDVESQFGAVSLGSATSSFGDVKVVAGGAANVSGTVSSAADYLVKGNSVTLANIGATQSAVGNILIQSATDIFASGTLAADSAGAGNKRLVLDASSGGLFSSTAGPVNLVAGSGAAPTAANRSDILLSFASGHNLTLGTVDADAFGTATHGAAPMTVADYTPVVQAVTLIPTLITDGAIMTGTVKTVQSTIIGSTGALAGARNVTLAGVTSKTGSVEVFAAIGDVSPGTVSAATFANLHADAGTLTAGDVRAFGGDATLLGGTAIAKASGAHVIAALNNVLLQSAGSVTVDTVRAGGTLTVCGLVACGPAASLTANSLQSNGDLSITTTGTIDVSAGQVGIATNHIAADLSGFTGAAVAAPASLSLNSTGGDVIANGLTATANVTVNANMTATVAGPVTAGADYSVTGNDVSLGTAAAATQAANGMVTVTAVRRITGASGLTLQANSDGTTGAGAEALTLTSGMTAPTLATDRSIDFAAGSHLIGGSLAAGVYGRESDVLIVQNANARGIRLGDVDARGLFGSPVTANGLLTVAGNGDLDTGTITVSEGLNLATTGSGAVTMAGAIVKGRGADVTPGFTATEDNLTVTSANIVNVTLARNFTSDANGGDVTLTGTNGVTAGDARAARDLTLSAVNGNIAATTLMTSRDLSLTAKSIGVPTPAVLRAGRSITATSTAGNVDIASATTTGFKLNAALTGDSATATASNGNVTAMATGGNAAVTLFSVAGTTGDLSVTADGDATAGTGTAGHSITVSTTGANKTALLTNGTATTGSIMVSAAAGDATAFSATALLGNITISALNAASLGSGMAGGTISVSGSSAHIGSGGAGLDILENGGTVTLGSGTAARDVTLNGNTVQVTTQATAGDDIVIVSSTGTVTAAQLTATGLGPDSEVDDSTPTLTTIIGLAKSNIVVQAKTTATISGAVSAARDYRVSGTSVTLGSPTLVTPVTQSAGGKIAVTATTGAANLLLGVVAGAPGDLISNFGGASPLAAGGLTVTSPTQVNGATTQLTARRMNPAALQNQQPGVTVSVAAAGSGITLASVNGGTVNIGAPGTINVPSITASGTVNVLGVPATAGTNDTATIAATTVTIDGAGVTTPPAADVTLSAGAGVTATTATTNGGKINNLKLLTDTGTAKLNGTSTPLADTASILVETQTGTAWIVNANAGTITAAGRQIGSLAQVTGTAHAATALMAFGDTAQIHIGIVDNGDLTVIGLNSATLDSGTTPGGSIDVSGGGVTIGTANALGHVIGSGSSVTLTSLAKGDDVVLTGRNAAASVTVNAGASVQAGGVGTVDLQGGNDNLTIGHGVLTTAAGSGYGATYASVLTPGSATINSPLTGNPLKLFGGNNIVLTGRDVTATGATANSARDIRVEAGRDASFGAMTAGRELIGAAGLQVAGNATVDAGVTLQAGDDLVLTSAQGSVAAGTATLKTTGSGPDAQSGNDALTALRADATGLADPAGTGNIILLGGSNLTAAASGSVTIGTANAARDLRVEAGSNATLTVATAGRELFTLGGTLAAGTTRVVTSATASGDIVLLAQNGAVTADGATLIANAGTDAQASDLTTALRADGTTLNSPLTGNALKVLAGSNIVLSGRDVSFIGGSATGARDIRVEAGRAASVGTMTAARSAIAVAGLTTAGDLSVEAGKTLQAGDDLIIGSAGGNVLAGSAVLKTTGAGSDTQAGSDSTAALRADGQALSIGTIAGQVVGLGGSNVIVAATGNTTVNSATAIRDLRIEAGLTGTLTTGSAGRELIAASGLLGAGDTIVSTQATAGDDLVLVSANGAVTAMGATLQANGTGTDAQSGSDAAALTRIGGTALLSPLTGVSLKQLAGSNIVLTARDVTNAGGSANANRDLRIEAGRTATLGTATALRNIYAAASLTTAGDLTVGTTATAGDDLVLLAGNGNVIAAGSTLQATGMGSDTQASDLTTAVRADGSALLSPLTGVALSQLGGSNIVISGTDIDFSGGSATSARDIRVEAGRDATLGTVSAGRTAILAAGLVQSGTLTVGTTASANDDLILVNASGDVAAGNSVLTAFGTGPDTQAGNDTLAALRADGSALADPTGAGAIVRLGGSNIVVAASGNATVGQAIATAGTTRDIRIAALGAATLNTSAAASRDVLLLGASATSTGATITAGDDAVVVALGGDATVGTITTTGTAASDETLITDPARDLSGNPLGLPGETALTRLDGSSILVAATGTATAPVAITSAGRYTVLGRSGVSLGDAAVPVTQTAAGDILLEASVAPAGAVPAADIALLGSFALTSNTDLAGAGDGIAFRLGNGSILGSAATVTVGRSPLETLANQGSVTSVAADTNGVKSITLLTVDAPTADLRALGDAALPEPADATVINAIFDGGFTLVSRTGQASLTNAMVSGSVPLMTAAELAGIDLKVIGGSGALLTSATDGLLRDITVATTSGTANIVTASARDDIVVASATGDATATTLTLGGAASDSEGGSNAVAATDANLVALTDPYQFGTGAALANLDGRNIVVSGATGATLTTANTVPGANSVRVQTLDGAALLTTAVNGAATPANTVNQALLVFTGSRTGSATTVTAAAANDIAVLGGTDATLTTGVAGRNIFTEAGTGTATAASADAGTDVTVVSLSGPAVAIGTATAGDDITVASAGTVTVTGTLAATGLGTDNEGGFDSITAKRFYGATLSDPAGAARGLTRLTGTSLASQAGSNVTVSGAGAVQIGTVAAATAVSAARSATLLSNTTLDVTGAIVGTTGDIVAVAPGGVTIAAQTAGRDIFDATTTGALLASGNATAGRDIFGETASGTLTFGGSATAGRDLTLVSTGGPSINLGSGQAGDDIVITSAGTVTTGALTSTGAGSDSEAGSDSLNALRYAGATITDPATAARGLTRLTGTTISTLGGGNVTVSGVGAVQIGTVPAATAVSAARSATLLSNTTLGVTGATVATTGDIVAVAPAGVSVAAQTAGRDIFDATTTGALLASGNATAGRDIFGETASGTLTFGGSATAGRDLTLVSTGGPSISLGSSQAGDDIVIASAGTVTTGALTSTGAGSDSEAGSDSVNALRYAGATITDPAPAARGLTRLTGTTINTLKGGNIAVSGTGAVQIAAAAAARSATLLSNATLSVTGATAATAGDIVAVAPAGVTLAAQTAGQDIFDATTTGALLASGNATAGRDIFGETASGTLTYSGNATAGRDLTLVSTGGPSINLGSGQAGDDIVIASAGTVTTGALKSTGAGADTDATDAATAKRYATAVIANPATAARAAAAATANQTFQQSATALAGLGNSPSITQLAGANVTVAAKGAIVVSAAPASAIAAPKRIALMSDAGVTVTGGVTATSGDYTVVAGTTATLGGAGQTQTSGSRVTVVAADLALTAALTAGNRIELIPHDSSTGTALTAVAVGGADAPAAAGTFALSNAELGLLSAPNLEIDAYSGVVTPAKVATSFGLAVVPAAIQNFAVRTTGDIVLNDKLSFTTTGPLRTLILGGALVGGAVEAGPSDTSASNVFANSVQVVTATGVTSSTVKGSIDAAGSTVALRANFIALGEASGLPTNTPFNTGLGAGTGSNPLLSQASIRTNYFLNPGSTFYTAVPVYTPQASSAPYGAPIVNASGTSTGTLVLATGQWALIQNTGTSSQNGGGIDVQRLQLVKLAATDPVVGVFGKIAGQGGFVAPIKIVFADLGGISPSNVRINGCVALQSASCILTGLAQPPIGLNDPARDLLLSFNPPAALPLELVVGASNDALWSDEECDKDLSKPCAATTVEAPLPEKPTEKR